VGQDHVSLIAKGVAYSWFLALFPGLIAAISIYGLVTSPHQVTSQVGQLSTSLPQSAQALITTQLKSIAGASGGALTVGLVISAAVALWSASAGMSGLVEALNIAYDESEDRNFVVKRGLALVLTLGFLVFLGLALGLIAVVPYLGSFAGSSTGVQVAVEVVRWLALVLLAIVALGLLYRVAPDREAPELRWLSLGSVVATVVWIAASLGFAFYVDNFGSYAKTYGALAGVVVLLLWMWITAFVVLLGAEINAESEAQTAADTTTGRPLPMGERGAVKADDPPQS
jgi:membrane protein